MKTQTLLVYAIDGALVLLRCLDRVVSVTQISSRRVNAEMAGLNAALKVTHTPVILTTHTHAAFVQGIPV